MKLKNPIKEQSIGARYEERFGNFDDLCFPSVVGHPKFAEMLARALQTGVRLTPEQVQAVFPDAAWEEVRP